MGQGAERAPRLTAPHAPQSRPSRLSGELTPRCQPTTGAPSVGRPGGGHPAVPHAERGSTARPGRPARYWRTTGRPSRWLERCHRCAPPASGWPGGHRTHCPQSEGPWPGPVVGQRIDRARPRWRGYGPAGEVGQHGQAEQINQAGSADHKYARRETLTLWGPSPRPRKSGVGAHPPRLRSPANHTRAFVYLSPALVVATGPHVKMRCEAVSPAPAWLRSIIGRPRAASGGAWVERGAAMNKRWR